jgi:hypothetical protein
VKISIAVAIALLFASSLLFGQVLANPTSLSFEAVPPNTSPFEDLAFLNQGSTTLTLSISISGPPFAIAENRCGNGVKPNTHCNLYLTYSPQSVGAVDSGSLTINYGSGVTVVQLSGQGVSSIPTWAHLGVPEFESSKVPLGETYYLHGQVGSEDKFYAPPAGETAYLSCTTNGEESINNEGVSLALCNVARDCPGVDAHPYGTEPYALAIYTITPTQTSQIGAWECTMSYDGDGLLGPSTPKQVKFEVVAPKN